jgi:hypothetical protein
MTNRRTCQTSRLDIEQLIINGDAMPLPRESRLATSAQQTLCIERPPLLHPGESTTTVIPDEILVEVFSYLGLKGSCFAVSKYQECLPLTLVCKRWRRVYEPFLYRRLDLGYFGWKKSRRVRQLLQNLQDRPDLGRQVKTIDIQAYNPNPSTSMNIAKIVTHCKAARHISLHMFLTDPTVPLLDAVARLPCLETLSVSGHSGGPSVYTILQYFNLPSLSNLRLCRYGIGKGTSPGASWPWDVPASAHDLDELLPSNRYHTSRVTSLELSDPSTPPRVTELILRWPQHLEMLSIHSLLHSSYAREYTLTCIERLLGIHRQSLKSITIGIIPGRRTGMPDFSSFECLEELHMSAYQLAVGPTRRPSRPQLLAWPACLPACLPGGSGRA